MPLDPGMEGVPVHLCVLPATGTECIARTETFFGSPKTTTSGADYTIDYSGLEGRFKIWEDAPAGYTETYPKPTSTPTDCGAPINECAPSGGHWILKGVSGPVLLEIGNFSSKTGARAMGFWRSRSGQVIVAGGTSTGGACDSGTWLRGYAPFQELSATAGCSQVAGYVSTVIRSANAGGPTMNAMLKGQVLATALDVYFTDPGLGGNKLDAPAPLGAVAVDLTRVCTDVPTCAVLEDDRGAFGGAGHLLVGELVAFASSRANGGGSWWYGNLKATQELAKDAFEAVNGQVTFAP